MDIESQLRKLETLYRSASTAAAAARAHHGALAEAPGVNPATLAHALGQYRRLEDRKRGIAAKIEAMEEFELTEGVQSR
jgi:hypothetical protein